MCLHNFFYIPSCLYLLKNFTQKVEQVAFNQMAYCIFRVPDENGVPRLYNMLEIHHSGPEPSICSDNLQTIPSEVDYPL